MKSIQIGGFRHLGNNVDPRGPEFGGALYNRTSDDKHKVGSGSFPDLLNSDLSVRQCSSTVCW